MANTIPAYSSVKQERSITMDPSTKRTLIRVAAAVCFLAAVLYIMSILRSITITVLVSFFLAYLLDPAAARLQKWGIRRSIASMALIFVGVLVVSMVILLVIPLIVNEILGLIASAPTYFAVLKQKMIALLEQYNISMPDNWREVFQVLLAKAKSWLPGLQQMVDPMAQAAAAVFRSTMTLVSVIVHVLLVPILTYYFLVSFDDFRDWIRSLIPAYARDAVLDKLGQIDVVVSGFVRGQLIICLILAVLYSLGFLIIGIKPAVLLGAVSGIMFIIPYVGTMIAVIGGAIMALAQYGDVLHVIYVLGWITVVQLAESYIFTPRIVGGATGLNPALYILALLAGAELAGFMGLLIAIPVAAVLKVLLMSLIEVYRESEIYQDRKTESDSR